jgi:hypothetical protein
MPTPDEMLRAAADTVRVRGGTHGDWRDNMENTAELWSAYLKQPIAAEQVAVMMVLVKVSRMTCGALKNLDDFDDLVGYGALAAALAYGEEDAEG